MDRSEGYVRTSPCAARIAQGAIRVPTWFRPRGKARRECDDDSGPRARQRTYRGRAGAEGGGPSGGRACCCLPLPAHRALVSGQLGSSSSPCHAMPCTHSPRQLVLTYARHWALARSRALCVTRWRGIGIRGLPACPIGRPPIDRLRSDRGPVTLSSRPVPCMHLT